MERPMSAPSRLEDDGLSVQGIRVFFPHPDMGLAALVEGLCTLPRPPLHGVYTKAVEKSAQRAAWLYTVATTSSIRTSARPGVIAKEPVPILSLIVLYHHVLGSNPCFLRWHHHPVDMREPTGTSERASVLKW
eukprot:5573333-Amphidinium_carterae.2